MPLKDLHYKLKVEKDFEFEKLEPYRMKIKKSELKEIENAKTFYGKHVAPFWE